MEVLIITYFFPPLNSIASLRPYSWAKYFSQLGVNVTVLTPTKYSFPSDLDLPFDGFKVVHIPIPKVFKIISLGKLINFLNERYSLGIYYKVRMPDETVRWVRPAYQWASTRKWDIIISTALPYTVHEIGYKLKKNGNCKIWVADWRDLFSENPIFTGLPFLKNIEKQKEKKFNTTADLITTVSQGLKNYWVKTTSKPVEVIYNGFFEEDYKLDQFCLDKLDKRESNVRIFYGGSLCNSRVVDYFFEALSEMDNPRVEFWLAGAFDPKKILKNYRINYRYLGFLKREEVIKIFYEVDFLFFPLEKEYDLPNWKGILTGKIFEYFGVNLYIKKPILVVGRTYDKEKEEILNRSGCCVFLKNKDEVQNFLGNYLKNGKVDIEPNREFIGFFARRNQARIFLEKIKELVYG